jgi:hypothetical protein
LPATFELASPLSARKQVWRIRRLHVRVERELLVKICTGPTRERRFRPLFVRVPFWHFVGCGRAATRFGWLQDFNYTQRIQSINLM